MMIRTLAMLCILAIACASCSKTATTTSAPPTETYIAPDESPASLLRRYAQWFPRDTLGVAVVDLRASFAMSTIGVSSDDPDVQKKLDAVMKSTQAKLRALLERRVGFAAQDAHTLILGFSEDEAVTVMLGVRAPTSEKTTIKGMDVHPIRARDPILYAPLFATPIDDGIVVFASRESILFRGEALGSDPKRLDELAGLIGERANAFVGALDLSAPGIREQLVNSWTVEPPRRIFASAGAELSVSIWGPNETLSLIDNTLNDLLNEIDLEAQRGTQGPEDEPLEDALAALAVSHGVSVVRAGLVRTVEGDRATYSLPLSLDVGESSAASLVPMVIGLAALSQLPDFMFSANRARSYEAEQMMRKFADGAQTYFTTEQRFSDPSGDQPWHVAGADERAAGFPVLWEEYVFPGGTSFSFSTSSEIPKGGAQIAPNPVVHQGTPEFLDKVLMKLMVDLNEPLGFRYTYTTLAEQSGGAVVIIKAEADYDPSTPEVYTIEQRVSIDPERIEVIRSPVTVTNEFE